jgi:hypothetical protein
MNNTAIISTLSAIVVVVIITAGSLVAAAAAATSSSSTPQPQNLICTHIGDNATCSHDGIIFATTTQIPLSTQQQPSATLTIIKHLINDIVGTIFAKNSLSSAGSSNASPQSSFPGAQSPSTTVTLNPGTFPAVLLQRANTTTTAAIVVDSNKCGGGGGDIITCIHNKETYHPAKDTTPFVLPIPFP